MRKHFLTPALAAIVALSIPTIACEAKGWLQVQKADGSVQRYPNATFTVVGKTLHIASGDKAGTIVISDAACTVDSNELMKCLPYSMVLVQNGTHPLDFHRGTIYYNHSNHTLTLPMSSTQLAPNGIVGLLVSMRGTYVTLSGTLDGRY